MAPLANHMGLNYSKVSPEVVEDKSREDIRHLRFSMMMCKAQSDLNRLFMFEHPSTAKSWTMEVARDIMKLPGVMLVGFDFCSCGMKSRDVDGEAPVKKRTRRMINSHGFAKRFVKSQRDGNHRHVLLINFRAGPGQEYIDEFCDEACAAVREELTDRNNLEECNLASNVLNTIIEHSSQSESKHPHPPDADGYHRLHEGMEFHDDVYGRPFDKKGRSRPGNWKWIFPDVWKSIPKLTGQRRSKLVPR